MHRCVVTGGPAGPARPLLTARAPRLAQRLAAAQRAPTQRVAGVILCDTKASKDGTDAAAITPQRRARVPRKQPAAAPQQLPPQAQAPQPYAEALLQREYELWQRQAGLYEAARAAHDADLQRWAAERATWQTQEAALRQEAAELRAQLLYVLAQLNGARQAGSGSTVGVGSVAPMPVPPIPPAPSSIGSSQAAVALPAASGSSTAGQGLSAAEQVQAVIDAMKPSAASTSSTTGSSWAGESAPPPAAAAASSTVSASEAWPEGADELPSYAADLAAAVAAVDTTDVLTGISNLSLPQRQAQAPAAAAAPQPVQPAAQQVPAAATPIEEQQATQMAAEAQRGPPPPLTLGADDIFWVNQLHTGLVDLGYYPGDEDIDEFLFGEGTQSAILTMQCCEGLPETGLADAATWVKLLGPELRLKPSRDLTDDMMLNVPGMSKLGGGSSAAASSSSSSGAAVAAGQQQQPAYTELFTAAFSETLAPLPDGSLRDVQQLTVTDQRAAGGRVVSDGLAITAEVAVDAAGTAQVSANVAEQHEVTYTDWPVLLEGDGGQAVHALQISLERAGYYPGEDDMRWWTFGDGTLAALKTFQACQGYPESGVCDAATWRLLLGQDAQPADIGRMRSGDSNDDDLDLQGTDRVWLLGEQRWENRKRLDASKHN